MEIHFHAHHAEISDAMRKRAERQVRRAAARIPRVVEAIIRFEEDGATRRVTLEFRPPRQRELMGSAEGRYFGPVLAQALARVLAQVAREKRGLSGRRAARRRTATRA